MEKKKILIVEDEGIVALQIKNSIEEMGYAVADIYSSGEEALENIEKLCPDLVMMDIKLRGEMDGIEAADRIRRQYDLPVIYLTAHSETGILKMAKMTEPYGYVLKPFNVQELQIAVELALHKHRVDMEKQKLTNELKDALEKVKLLSGMLPICSSCKKVRDDRGYWNQIEVYIRDHSEAEFSHGICPECAKKLYPEYFKEE
jgi:CheY-like chemotaxis protein